MKTFLFLIVPVLLIQVSCKKPEAVSQNKTDVRKVKTTNPISLYYSQPIRVAGLLTTRSEVKLSFKTAGIIEKISVKEGERVESGSLLASLDLSEMKAQVKQAEIAYDKAKRDLKRAENLYADSVVTLETLQNARSAYEIASAQMEIAVFNLKHSKIVAPGDGKIQKILIKKNEMAAPGHPVLLFGTTESDWIVRVSLTDKDIVKMRLNDSAIVHMDAFPDKLFDAKVSELGSFADPVIGTYEVELLLKQMDEQFRTGFISRVNIFPSDSVPAMWVPMKSVVDIEDDIGYVFLVDNQKARKCKVTLSGLKNDGVLIMDGIQENDEIISEGAGYLRDGDELKIMN